MGLANGRPHRPNRHCDRDAPQYFNGHPSFDDDYSAYFGERSTSLRGPARSLIRKAAPTDKDDFEDTSMRWEAASQSELEELFRERMGADCDLHQPGVSGSSTGGSRKAGVASAIETVGPWVNIAIGAAVAGMVSFVLVAYMVGVYG